MTSLSKEIATVDLTTELKQSYLDYAMSVIVGRALPDVRDGLKPVHRRILYAMHELGNVWNKPYKKSARVVGDVIGKYHPHGDAPVYDAIVRMAQPFAMRYMLIDGQGNFGSIDGDAPAAMRYTEIRMSRFAETLLQDIEKETVDFTLNYDETEWVPSVLPAQVPNLLINGSAGIAVGMATNIPPHNLEEVIAACIALLKEPELDVQQLMNYIPGPDFPTAGIINGRKGIAKAYATGRGSIYVRARTHVETDEQSGKQSIIVTELPYQVNKARLIERIAELVKDKKITGITALRDESDKDGMRIVMEVKRGDLPEIILNNLYSHTQLETAFGINMVALVDGQPRLLNLKEILQEFLKHRREVVTRRTLFQLRKARERAHILEGLAIALANIDPIIAIIRSAQTPAIAKEKLLSQVWPLGSVTALLQQTDLTITRPEGLPKYYGLGEAGYRLSPEQAQAILDLRLHRLTGLEQEKIANELYELISEINRFLTILVEPKQLQLVIHDELVAIREQFMDKRRTEIIAEQADVSEEDLITPTDMVVTLSHTGYIKAQPLDYYQAQQRGGKGKAATQVKEEDFIEQLWVAHSHDTLLCFTNRGKVYWLKTYQLPQAGRVARGKPINNLLPLEEGEKVSAILPITEYTEDRYVFMTTEQGVVKKLSLTHFSRPRLNGLIALALPEDDRLIGAAITDGKQDIMLVSNAGKAIRFSEDEVRCMGRLARGVRGMRLRQGQRVISLIVVEPGEEIVTVTANGYGKRTALEEFRRIGRGGQGVIAMSTSRRNGELVGAVQVTADDELMLISTQGVLVRIRVADIAQLGRSAQGVRLMRLAEHDALNSIARISREGEQQ